jgi:glycerol kinase
MANHLLAIDQGTTGSTALVVEIAAAAGGSAAAGRTLGRATVDFPQHFPKPGWVSHDAREIWRSVEASVKQAIKAAGARPEDIAAIGITNQRETTVVWDRATRQPIDLAIVWQCRRTADVCDELKKDSQTVARVREKTGLVIDAYFSATKIAWLLDNVAGARVRAERGDLAFGTIDSFLVSELTAGAVHVTDVTNASRTLLMNLSSAKWDPDLLNLFRVPSSVLPRIVGNAEIVGRTRGVSFVPDGVPIAGMAGDQQAALFGQACFAEGDAKCTYGTGAFALMNIGPRPLLSENGLVTTAAWQVGGHTTYALEGSAFVAGAAVQWLRDGLGIIKSAREIEALARSVPSSDGVVFVPALAGLGAPHWDQGPRLDHGAHARDDGRAPRSRHARRHRSRGVRSALCDGQGRETRARTPASRRGRCSQRHAHAVPGGRRRRRRREAVRHRVNGPGGGHARGHRRRHVPRTGGAPRGWSSSALASSRGWLPTNVRPTFHAGRTRSVGHARPARGGGPDRPVRF